MQILVIEDSQTPMVREVLEILGFRVRVHNYKAVEKFIAQSVPGGILLDVDGGTPDGMNLLSQILDCYPHVPVITMADAKNIGLLRKSIELGASEYLVKPLDQQVLKIKCAEIFLHRSST